MKTNKCVQLNLTEKVILFSLVVINFCENRLLIKRELYTCDFLNNLSTL